MAPLGACLRRSSRRELPNLQAIVWIDTTNEEAVGRRDELAHTEAELVTEARDCERLERHAIRCAVQIEPKLRLEGRVLVAPLIPVLRTFVEGAYIVSGAVI